MIKKIMTWLYALAIVVFFIDWAYVGVQLLSGNYDITAGAYVGLVCVMVMLVYILYRLATNKCPHCEKLIYQARVRYCPHCGKEIKAS